MKGFEGSRGQGVEGKEQLQSTVCSRSLHYVSLIWQNKERVLGSEGSRGKTSTLSKLIFNN